MFDLRPEEKTVFDILDTPEKIQDFLDRIPRNFEKQGDTLHSPRMVLTHRKAHCFEGALLAAAVLLHHKKRPLLLDLQAEKRLDDSHVVTLYKQNGYWGAISKTNHASLGWRDPIYKTPREVALTYFHEYFNEAGAKSLRTFATYDPTLITREWVTDERPLLWLHKELDVVRHTPFIPRKNAPFLRRATPLERKAGSILAWKRNDTRT